MQNPAKLVGLDIAYRKMASVKLLFRNAAHSERPTEPVSNSKTPVFSCISENESSKKVRIQGWYGEPLKSSDFPSVRFNREARGRWLLAFRVLSEDFIVPAKSRRESERSARRVAIARSRPNRAFSSATLRFSV